MSQENIIILSFFVFLAGFIDSMAGGGGLITLPAYLNYGVKEEFLLGTNKLSSTLGTLMAVVKFFKELSFKKKYLLFIFILSAIGSISGAIFISYFVINFIKYILIIAIPLISIFLITNKNFGLSDFSSYLDKKEIYKRSFFISFIISFYDGMLGPGTGTFLALSYSKFCGYDLIKATALSKFTNLISNISALITFLYFGKVNVKLGLFMGLISIFGNFLGSHLALKKGVWIIKPLLFIISNALLIKIISDMIR